MGRLAAHCAQLSIRGGVSGGATRTSVGGRRGGGVVTLGSAEVAVLSRCCTATPPGTMPRAQRRAVVVAHSRHPIGCGTGRKAR